MTEAEANKKWCPFARIADGEPGVTVNRPDHYGGDFPRCIGSACMAWRLFLGSSTNEHATGGYCGLVGKS